MASRYDSAGANSGPQYSFSTSSSNEQSATQSSRSSSSSSRTNESSTTSYNIDTMSSAGRQALDQLIATLSAGGTPEQRKNRQLVLSQINNLEALSRGYSRQNAFADAEGLMNQTLRRAMEEALPSILQAQAAAGTSGDALSALLSQDAATRASEAASAQGLNAAVDYGQILASLQGQKTQAVTSLEDVVTQALINALGVNAGSMKRGTETTKASSSSSSRSTESGSSTTQSSGKTTSLGATSSNQGDITSFRSSVGA